MHTRRRHRYAFADKYPLTYSDPEVACGIIAVRVASTKRKDYHRIVISETAAPMSTCQHYYYVAGELQVERMNGNFLSFPACFRNFFVVMLLREFNYEPLRSTTNYAIYVLQTFPTRSIATMFRESEWFSTNSTLAFVENFYLFIYLVSGIRFQSSNQFLKLNDNAVYYFNFYL